MDQRYLSTAEASKALGVSVSTVKRWVDDGILPAHKTAGGHRKLLLSDVVRLGRAGRLPNLDVSRLEVLGGLDVPKEQEDLKTLACKALDNADGNALRSVVMGAYQTGLAINCLFDDIILPAIQRLVVPGSPERSFRYQQALQECKGSLYELKSVLELRATQQCPLAVGGAGPSDHDPLQSLLIQLVLLDAGWDPVNLGPNTPLESFGAALAELRPRLLWFSFSKPLVDDSAIDSFNRVSREAMSRGVCVVLHGPGLSEQQRRLMSYTTYADRMEHVAALAQAMHPAPKIPRRGRPTLDGSAN
ncbi:excisionase family DNA-binding protein [bacterium]|nr:excisionase family DNA-binding protein [bacterium]